MKRTSRRACAIAAATLTIVGCGGGLNGTSSGTAQAGAVTALQHQSVYVAGAPAGEGTVIYANQHVKTDPAGQASYTVGMGPLLLTCSQDTGTDVTAEPSAAVLLHYDSGLTINSTVTCGTSPSKGSQSLTLSAPGLKKITVNDPIFTIVCWHGMTIIRVYEGSVTVTSSAGGPAVTVTAWRQLAVTDGQPAGAPTAFNISQISKFELRAYEQLAKIPVTTPSKTDSGGSVPSGGLPSGN